MFSRQDQSDSGDHSVLVGVCPAVWLDVTRTVTAKDSFGCIQYFDMKHIQICVTVLYVHC